MNLFKEDYKVLNTEVRKLGYNMPPIGKCIYEFISDDAHVLVLLLIMDLVMLKKLVF